MFCKWCGQFLEPIEGIAICENPLCWGEGQHQHDTTSDPDYYDWEEPATDDDVNE